MQSVYHTGYRLIPCESDSEHQHLFCGENTSATAMCPNCIKPLYRVLQIDTTDPCLHSQTELSLSSTALFTCFTCNIVTDKFYYRLLDNAANIEILRYEVGQFGPETCYAEPYQPYPDYFPLGRFSLEPIGAYAQQAIHDLNCMGFDGASKWYPEDDLDLLYQPIRQIGGEPFFVQPYEDNDLICPLCLKGLPYLASADDTTPGPQPFSGDSGMQIFFGFCNQCQVVGSFIVSD